jgi:hypothetical protein
MLMVSAAQYGIDYSDIYGIERQNICVSQDIQLYGHCALDNRRREIRLELQVIMNWT